MEEKSKKENKDLSEFSRYIRGEMTRREENAFQRKLQKDPFAEEAVEGFSQITPQEANADMDSLWKKLKIRIGNNQRRIFYRIAASVAVLMIISSVFIIVVRNKPVRQLSMGPVSPAQKEIVTDSKLSTEPLVAEVENVIKTPEKDADKEISNDEIKTAVSAEIENPATAKETETLVMIDKKDTTLYIAEDQVAAPAEVKSEMDVVAYGAAKSARANIPDTALINENVQTVYSPPAPVNGKESFDRYIEDNIRKPAIMTAGEKTVVVISFRVQSSGIIDSLKVISSPGIEFSDEAIRLIKEGPSWNPAEENNIKIDGEIRLNIVFK